MKLQFNLMLAALCLLAVCTVGAADKANLPQAIEAERLQIVLHDDLNGYITGKVCDQCKSLKLIITPDTQAIAGVQQVSLLEARERSNKSALVMFERASLKVISIAW